MVTPKEKTNHPSRKLTAKRIWSLHQVKATLIGAAVNLVAIIVDAGGVPESIMLLMLILILNLLFIALGALFVAAIFGAVMTMFKKQFLQSLGTGYSIAVIAIPCFALWGML